MNKYKFKLEKTLKNIKKYKLFDIDKYVLKISLEYLSILEYHPLLKIELL
jgi:hypothetical protein